jgi:hypothetical protein
VDWADEESVLCELEVHPGSDTRISFVGKVGKGIDGSRRQLMRTNRYARLQIATPARSAPTFHQVAGQVFVPGSTRRQSEHVESIDHQYAGTWQFW